MLGSTLPLEINTQNTTHKNVTSVKPATHLPILYADRGEFDRQRKSFRWRLMRTHLAIFFADCGDVAVLKTYVIKSSNLMGWLYWRLAVMAEVTLEILP